MRCMYRIKGGTSVLSLHRRLCWLCDQHCSSKLDDQQHRVVLPSYVVLSVTGSI
jgi:hypothetical protein